MATAQQELSGRERILSATIELFGTRGVDAVSMRDIAKAADVSPALLVHHFGSKVGLKEAADARVVGLFTKALGEIEESLDAASVDPSARSMIGIAALMNLVQNPELAAYMRRLLVEGAPATGQLLAAAHVQGVELQQRLIARGLARDTDDLDTRVALMIMNSLMILVMREQIQAMAGYDPLTEDGLERWLNQLRGMYLNGILTLPE